MRSGNDVEPGTFVTFVAGAIALAVCCGGSLLAAVFGLSALAAVLIRPWFLIPIVMIAALVAALRRRSGSVCDLPSTEEANHGS